MTQPRSMRRWSAISRASGRHAAGPARRTRSLASIVVGLAVLLLALPLTAQAQTTISKRVAAASDDAEEEGPTGTLPNRMWLNSSDIELVSDFEPNTAGAQTIGLRFTAMTVPAGATITGAYLTFRAIAADPGMTNSDATNLTIKGQLVANAPTCAPARNPRRVADG